MVLGGFGWLWVVMGGAGVLGGSIGSYGRVGLRRVVALIGDYQIYTVIVTSQSWVIIFFIVLLIIIGVFGN